MDKATTIADRIRARLAATGKSASAVSIEAGLSRSGIRDILNGKAGNPRVDTLLKLAGPLECSLAYLTGFENEGGMTAGSSEIVGGPGAHFMSVRAVLKAGVYADSISNVGEVDPRGELHAVTLPPAVSAQDVHLYRIGDDTMIRAGLSRGDLLIALVHRASPVEALITNSIIVVERALAGLPSGPFEYSARIVATNKGNIRLSTAPKLDAENSLLIDKAALRGPAEDGPDRLALNPSTSGSVRIIGVALRLIRDYQTI